MYYIFNSDDKIIGWCDFEPDNDDLLSRGEYAEKHDEYLVIQKTEEELKAEQTTKILRERNKALKETDWMISRQIEQQNLQLTTTLTKELFTTLLNHRQKLRDITGLEEFPFIELPVLNLEG